METVIKMAGVLLAAVLVCLLWGCQAEDVADFSEETRIVEVVGELDDANSQAAAEAAIRTLFNTAEMGEAFPGSRYEAYAFSDEGIADLAELHLLYLNGEFEPSLAHTFEAIMRVADDISAPKMDFDTAMDLLAGETEAAFADPEEPANALLLAIASEDGNVPETVPSYYEDTVRSPVQNMLFAIWFHRRFAGMSKSPGLAPGEMQEEPPTCESLCYQQYLLDKDWCELENEPGTPEYDRCMDKAEKDYLKCLRNCHSQGESS